jgi:AbrB family looped-hinge helix DNA binding protein
VEFAALILLAYELGFTDAKKGLTVHFAIDFWDNPRYYAIMMTQLTIDSAGRIVLPKPIRKELDIGPGDLLELERVGERITLRPVRGGSPLAKEKGVWVFRAGQPLPASVTDDLLEQIREQRDKQNLAASE